MAEQSHLPELPLMLAGIPRPVAAVLEAAGVPVEALPRVPLTARGCGRFVLFDSRNVRSACQARQAARQGLVPIDLRELGDGIDGCEAAEPQTASGPTEAAQPFLERLKGELERRGGIWIRVGVVPYPFRSALCLGVEHPAANCADFAAIADSLPAHTTHFVSSLLRGDELTSISQAGPVELGWRILPEDCQRSRRGTLSHWMTRMERFRAVGRSSHGLLITRPDLALPVTSRLAEPGFRYAVHPDAMNLRIERDANAPAEAWTRFATAGVPARESPSQWVRRCYRARHPLFVTATTDRLPVLRELLAVAHDFRRCPLMWQPSFGEFARWWQMRRRLKLQVWRRDGGCEVHAEGEFAAYPWSLEIRRGEHLATVPLSRLEMHVPDEGLVYQQIPSRTASGCTLPNENQTVIDHPVPEEGQRLAA